MKLYDHLGLRLDLAGGGRPGPQAVRVACEAELIAHLKAPLPHTQPAAQTISTTMRLWTRRPARRRGRPAAWLIADL